MDTTPSSSVPPNYITLPAPPELTYMSSQDAINAMVDFAKTAGYGMSLKRSKPDGKDAVKTRFYYHCDRHGNYSPKGTIRERTSRSTGCLFQIMIQKPADSPVWHLKVKNSNHNHGPMAVPERLPGNNRPRKSLPISVGRKTYKVALIPGDGIGIEVVEAARLVLSKLSLVSQKFDFHFQTFDWGSEMYRTMGFYLPNDAVAKLKKFDAILFGAVGAPGVQGLPNLNGSQSSSAISSHEKSLNIYNTTPRRSIGPIAKFSPQDITDHVSLWGLLQPLRTQLKQYVNVRPVRVLRGIASPLRNVPHEFINWLIIRENSEGEYAGHGGISHGDTAHGVATDVSIFTRPAIERIFRFAFDTARQRPRKRLTLITKSNAQKWGMVYWDKIFDEMKSSYPDVTTDVVLIDSMPARMITEPQTFDTIVATSLHADILADLAAALSGSIGIAPSNNLDPTRKHPSMFEPVHGSAPDIAGKGIANPLGAFWSAAEMIRWLGEEPAAEFLMQAVENITSWGVKTRDLNGQNGTAEVASAVMNELERLSRAAPQQ